MRQNKRSEVGLRGDAISSNMTRGDALQRGSYRFMKIAKRGIFDFDPNTLGYRRYDPSWNDRQHVG